MCRKTYYQPSLGLPSGPEDGEDPIQKKEKKEKPLFLIPDPTRPYRYWAPGRAGFEERAKGTTPFETFWYVHFGGLCAHADVRAWWLKKYQPHSTCALPDPNEALPQQQRLQKRRNPRARMIAAAKSRDERRPDAGAKRETSNGVYYDPEKARRAAETRRLAESAGAERGGEGKQKRRKKEKKSRGKKTREEPRRVA